MNTYLIDTDWIIQVLHGNRDATETLYHFAPEGLAVSLITYGELYQGAHFARDAQQALDPVQDFLDGIEILPLTEAIMRRFAIVHEQLTRGQHQHVSDMDLLIAATALEHGLILVTYNPRDYQLLPDLILHRP